jgi:DNA-binding NtrC family response regulator
VVGERLTIQPGDLPDVARGAPPPQPDDESLVRLPAKIEWLEQRAIRAALRATDGNQKRAALLLGISRNTLHRKMRADDGGVADD